MRPLSEPTTVERRDDRPAAADSWTLSRIVAVVVLVPAVPLLLMSVLALAAFYGAPTRFNALLVRLPGDELIRTALIFAPATLAAVVVMAVLYANDVPKREVAEAKQPAAPRRGLRARQRGGLARASLWITLPALMLVAAAQLVAFVAPGRFDRLLDALPATTLITRLFELSPIVALAAVGLGLVLGFVPGREAGAGGIAQGRPPAAAGSRVWTTARIARLGALLILVPASGLLLLSLTGLAMSLASPERLAWLAEKLPAETLIRLGLAFAPAMLLGLVLLAALYLVMPARAPSIAITSPVLGEPLGQLGEASSPGPAPPGAASASWRGHRPPDQAYGSGPSALRDAALEQTAGNGGAARVSGESTFRSGLAVGVLVAGLGFTVLAGMAVLVSVVFVLAAR